MTMKHDDEARLDARSLVEARELGVTQDMDAALRKLDEKTNSPERLKAQRESQAYMDNYTSGQHQGHAKKRGSHRGVIEKGMMGVNAAAVQLDREIGTLNANKKAADSGDKKATSIVETAERRITKLEGQIRDHAGTIRDASIEYQRIPAHPYPKIDKRAAQREEQMETHDRKMRELGYEIGAGVITLAPMGKAASVPVRAGAAAIGALPAAGLAFTHELRAASADAFRSSGVDLSDQKALESWPKKNADRTNNAVNRSFQAGFANMTGSLTGHLTSEKFGDLVGFGADLAVDFALQHEER